MRNIKVFGFAFLIAAVLTTAGASFIQAKENDKKDKDEKIEDLVKLNKFTAEFLKENKPRSPQLNVSPQGKAVVIAGEVTEVSWPNLKVKVWGLTLNVKVLADAHIIGGSNTTATSTSTTTPSAPISIAVGDKVDLLGDMDQSNGTLNARQLRDRTQSAQLVSQIQERIKQLLEEIKKLRLLK